MINLIDSLIEEKPRIDYESGRIYSDIKLSDVIGYDVKNDDKSELVDFAAYLDEQYNTTHSNQYGVGYNGYVNIYYNSYKYRELWKKLGLKRFVISKRLLDFLSKESDLYVINKIFSLDISFISEYKKNIIENFSVIIENFNYLIEGDKGYLLYGEKRQQIKYGRFINMILDGIYDKDNGLYNHRMVEIEKSVNIYKSVFNTRGYRISVLNGDDILLGYERKFQVKKGGTMLSQSCMNDKTNLLKLYSNNPNKIYLFVVTNYDGKIISRNLVWRLKKLNNFLFDRVYSMDNYISKAVTDLANSENWIVYNEGRGVRELKKLDNEGNPKRVKGETVKIKLNFNGIKSFPYLDTFRFQRRWTKTVTNKKMYKLCYVYEQTGGSRTKR